MHLDFAHLLDEEDPGEVEACVDEEGEEGGGADEKVPAPAYQPGEGAQLIIEHYAALLERMSAAALQEVLTSTMLAEARANTSSWSNLGTHTSTRHLEGLRHFLSYIPGENVPLAGWDGGEVGEEGGGGGQGHQAAQQPQHRPHLHTTIQTRCSAK